MKRHFVASLALLFLAFPACAGFVGVQGTSLVRDGKPYRFVGANFWYGMNLGSKGPSGDRARLLRELDRLQALGVTNLRVVGASEGPDTEPWRIVPALQKKPGKFDPALLDGLDFLISEMGKRGMTAVVVLNDFWPWSGGMAQYVSWYGGGPIPYPPPAEGGDWTKYQKYTARFYKIPAAQKDCERVIKKLITRRNSYSKRLYRDEPAIMAWELANEPRGIDDPAAYRSWVARTASFIKSFDKNHLVTTGSEGETADPKSAGLDFSLDHADKNVDYATMHLWAANWGWFDPSRADATYPETLSKAGEYIRRHVELAKALGKPVVLEEFGITRTSGSYSLSAGTELKDRYYAWIFGKVLDAGAPLCGVNFWAWAGEGRPRKPGGYWKPGDPFIGDPPHEAQGWYGVYDADEGTKAVIKDFSAKMAGAAAKQ